MQLALILAQKGPIMQNKRFEDHIENFQKFHYYNPQ
jgi:hypothetical protein